MSRGVLIWLNLRGNLMSEVIFLKVWMRCVAMREKSGEKKRISPFFS
jgi:hypothetical protein